MDDGFLAYAMYYISDVAPISQRKRGARHIRRASLRDSALKFKQARAYETDEIEAALKSGGDTL